MTTVSQRMKRAAVLSVVLGVVGVFGMASPASADDDPVVTGGASADPYCVDSGAAVDVNLGTDPATPGFEVYVVRLHDFIYTDYSGVTGSDGTYSVTIPIAEEGINVVQFGHKLPSGEITFNGGQAGDANYYFPEECAADPDPTPDPTPTETTTPTPEPTETAGPVVPSGPADPEPPATGATGSDDPVVDKTPKYNTLSPAKTDGADLVANQGALNPVFAGMAGVFALVFVAYATAVVVRRRRGEQH